MNHSPIAGPQPGRFRFVCSKFKFILFILIAAAASISARAQITEYVIPTGGSLPESIVAGPDGAYWFTEFNTERIGRIDTNGVVTEPIVMTSNTAPFRIILGPDTNLWFTEAYADKIGRISSGTNTGFTNVILTDFKIHTNSVTNCQPSGVAFGPDGNLWFLELTSDLVGVMGTNGVLLHEYGSNIFQHFSGLYNITAGPDGAMWFTEIYSNNIGRIDTSGNITEFKLPFTNSQPMDIISGPDGALWFTEFNSNRIGRLTTTGVYSDYILPSIGPSSDFFSQEPYRLTTGSDGNIWFSEYLGASIARLNLKATNFVSTGTNNTNFITEYFTPTPGSTPTGIASGGPDKGIWFVERNVGLAGQFLVPTLTISVTTNSQFVLSWPVSATDYILQGNTNLSSTNWINLTSPAPFVVSNTFVYTNTVTNLDFFRLFLNTIP